jgi:hypothetical protein
VERCPDEVKKALESMFYREDLASTIQYCEDMLTMIQGYNLYKKNIHMDDKPYLQEHVPTIRGLIDKLKSFPTSVSVLHIKDKKIEFEFSVKFLKKIFSKK